MGGKSSGIALPKHALAIAPCTNTTRLFFIWRLKRGQRIVSIPITILLIPLVNLAPSVKRIIFFFTGNRPIPVLQRIRGGGTCLKLIFVPLPWLYSGRNVIFFYRAGLWLFLRHQKREWQNLSKRCVYFRYFFIVINSELERGRVNAKSTHCIN